MATNKSAAKNSAKKAVAKKAVPAAPKAKVPKEKKAKVAAAKKAVEKVVLSPRERYITNLCRKLTLTIPPVETMFATQLAKGCVKVPLAKLATFCKANNWVKSKGVIGSAMDEVAGFFGDDNFLNLSAEVDMKQVEKVIKDILEFGSLIHTINVCNVTEVPETINHDPSIYQVFDGRHRVVALSIIYGEALEIPVEITEFTYINALYACVVSNDTRAIKKLESIHFQGLKDGGDAGVAYAKKNGKIPSIAKFVAAHALKQVPVPALRAFEKVNVVEKLKGTKGITAVNFTNTIKEALGILSPRINTVQFNKQTVNVFNLITEVIERTWIAIDTRSGGKKANTAWNAYSSNVLGRCIGRRIDKWIVDKTQIKADTIQGFADQLAQVVISFMDQSAELYARTPTNQLEAEMLSYADAKLGITLPRVESDLFIEEPIGAVE